MSCETNPIICYDIDETPIIYAIFDNKDIESRIYVAKTFSGDPLGPLINSKISDSIYFKDITIRSELFFRPIDGSINQQYSIWKIANEENVINRQAGVFAYPLGKSYIIRQELKNCFHVQLEILIPSYDTIFLETPIIDSPILDYPQTDNSWISFYRSKLLPIRWYGNSWNEIQVEFEIETITFDSHTINDTLIYHQSHIIYPEDKRKNYFVSYFSFENYLQLLNSQLSFIPDVKYRKIKNINVEVICGNNDFKEYMIRIGDFHDYSSLITYNSKPQSLVTSKSSKKIFGLRLDPESIEELENDSALAKYKFIY